VDVLKEWRNKVLIHLIRTDKDEVLGYPWMKITGLSVMSHCRKEHYYGKQKGLPEIWLLATGEFGRTDGTISENHSCAWEDIQQGINDGSYEIKESSIKEEFYRKDIDW
jgi:hypothetical protein